MAIFGTSEAAKAQKGGQSFQKKMMQTAHQWEVQDLISAGLNPILSATGGGPTAFGTQTPFGPSSAQDVAAGVGALGTATSSGKEVAFARTQKQILDNQEKVTAAQELTEKRRANLLGAQRLEQETKTGKNRYEGQLARAMVAGATATSAKQMAGVQAALHDQRLDQTDFGEWARYINRISRSITGRQQSSADR